MVRNAITSVGMGNNDEYFNSHILKMKKATAEANNQILYTESLNIYVNSMQKSLQQVKNFLSETELRNRHDVMRYNSVTQARIPYSELS